MKHLAAIIIAILVVTACTNTENQMNLTGTITGLKKGTLVLQKLGDSTLITIDSVQVQGDENFSFVADIPSPELLILNLKVPGEQKSVSFFGQKGEVTLTTSLKDFGNDVTVMGSPNQDKFEEYKKLMQRYADKNVELTGSLLEAASTGNDSLVNQLNTMQQRVVASSYLATVNYALNNKDYVIAPYLALSEISNANVKYLDTIYKSLPIKIKDSKYGVALESYIKEVRNAN